MECKLSKSQKKELKRQEKEQKKNKKNKEPEQKCEKSQRNKDRDQVRNLINKHKDQFKQQIIQNLNKQQYMFNVKIDEQSQKEEILKDLIDVQIENAQFYSTAEDILNMKFNDYNIINSVYSQCPFNHQLYIIDLKLDVFGPNEDFYYSTLPFLVKNIRRGMTIIAFAEQLNEKQINDDSQINLQQSQLNEDQIQEQEQCVKQQEVYNNKPVAKLIDFELVRKGLMKFFDLRLSYISKEERNVLNQNTFKFSLYQEKNYILGPVLKAISDGDKVQVLKTLKANGENAQISYSSSIQSWIICSKNVALAARSTEDIHPYIQDQKNDRYKFSSEIAYVFFDHLNKMSQQKVQDLQKDLDGKTMIGEYIGSEEHQHLVKYSRKSIIFYALVDNHSQETCLPCEYAFQLFHKYSFDVVHIQEIGIFDNYNKMCDQLQQTFKDVAKSPIAQDEEGNVLYFIKISKDNQEQQVLSLAKLKTLEYRLFRKMREKLRAHYKYEVKQEKIQKLDENFKIKNKQIDEKEEEKEDQKSNEQQQIKEEITNENKQIEEKMKLISKFKNESLELLENGQNQLPNPLEYYTNIFEQAFDFIEENPNQVEILHNKYVDFQENLMKHIYSKNSDNSSVDAFFASKILDIQTSLHQK